MLNIKNNAKIGLRENGRSFRQSSPGALLELSSLVPCCTLGWSSWLSPAADLLEEPKGEGVEASRAGGTQPLRSELACLKKQHQSLSTRAWALSNGESIESKASWSNPGANRTWINYNNRTALLMFSEGSTMIDPEHQRETRTKHHPRVPPPERGTAATKRCPRNLDVRDMDQLSHPQQREQEATRNKCHASSNRCLTSSNKKLLGTRSYVRGSWHRY